MSALHIVCGLILLAVAFLFGVIAGAIWTMDIEEQEGAAWPYPGKKRTPDP
jgi:hypothetical protein